MASLAGHVGAHQPLGRAGAQCVGGSRIMAMSRDWRLLVDHGDAGFMVFWWESPNRVTDKHSGPISYCRASVRGLRGSRVTKGFYIQNSLFLQGYGRTAAHIRRLLLRYGAVACLSLYMLSLGLKQLSATIIGRSSPEYIFLH